MKHEEVASKMGKKYITAPSGRKFEITKSTSRGHQDIDFKHKAQKGRESLNSPKRGRDNEVASGKNEQEKS